MLSKVARDGVQFMSFIASKIIRLLQLYFYHLIVCEAKLLIIVLSIR